MEVTDVAWLCVTDDIAKSMTAKKRKLEQVTASSVSSGSRKFDDVWRAQQSQRFFRSHKFWLVVGQWFVCVCVRALQVTIQSDLHQTSHTRRHRSGEELIILAGK